LLLDKESSDSADIGADAITRDERENNKHVDRIVQKSQTQKEGERKVTLQTDRAESYCC